MMAVFIVEAFGAELRLKDTEAGPADPVALRIGLIVVLVRQSLLIVGIWALHRLIAARGTPFPLSVQRWWPIRPQVAFWAAGLYAAVIAYGAFATLSGIDWLIPQSTVGTEVARDPTALALAGLLAVVVAPLSEELLFRGAVFGALSRFGIAFGAIVSGFLFAVPHFDTGSTLPLTLVGAALALIFFRYRSLAAAVQVHALFNSVSFVLLIATA